MQACLKAASHRLGIRVEPEELDANLWLLNVNNGTINLETGELQPHRREDLITKLAPVTFDPAAECPRFDQFMRETMDNDLDRVRYLLTFLGYGLTGFTTAHKFGLWHGPKARNGKGTLIHLLQRILGDYVAIADPEVLLHSPGQHTTGLLDFRGARMVFASEPGEGRRWNESLIKQLTGGDTMKARAMGKNFIEFDPNCLLIVASNSRPLVREQGPAFWARVSLLPWDVSWLGREDLNLGTKLLAEASGVLRLLLAGCAEWRQHGLVEPASVAVAGDEYRSSQDTLGAFLSDRLEPHDDGFVPRADLYRMYQMWASLNGEPFTLSARVFYRKLDERQFQLLKRNGTRGYLGWVPKSH